LKVCPIAIMAPHFQEQNERHVQLQQDTTQVCDQLHDLESKFEELEASFKQLSTSIKRERRRSLATGGTVSASRVEEITGRLDELATDYNSRLDNATSDNARMHMAFMNENLRNQQQFHTLNATLTVMRNQLNHLAALRATGSNATAGSGTGATNSGSSGVGMDSGRREPPKL
jgi:site-specific recombinase